MLDDLHLVAVFLRRRQRPKLENHTNHNRKRWQQLKTNKTNQNQQSAHKEEPLKIKLTTTINSKHKDCNPKTKKEQNPQQKLLPTKKTTESPTTNNVEKKHIIF